MPLYLRGSMQVHSHIHDLPPFRNAVITIGTFDGVHKGHQQIISALREQAEKVAGESVLITFMPHPRKLLQPETSLELINTLDEKIELLRSKGIDHLVVVDFTKSFAALTGEEYIEHFLVKQFKPQTIIIGYDHHFGSNRSGNFELLQKRKSDFGYELIEIPKHVLDEISVSSTSIRQALKEGNIKKAVNLLGYPFSFEGIVVHGDKLGRQLGYPTANLQYKEADKIHLGEGVYAVWVKVAGEMKGGMLSIGKRPTLNDTVERVEVNIFDFDSDIYDQEVVVIPVAYLRAQEKYDTLEKLTIQLGEDKIQSLAILETNPASF
ncbi:MAG: riboflavin biosynthesis protein RibF [Flaviaesturariibacter sp.]|nr:riboflavin biosynthesis protein RibF [Flaviaesturariibacter sp.]